MLLNVRSWPKAAFRELEAESPDFGLTDQPLSCVSARQRMAVADSDELIRSIDGGEDRESRK